MPLIQHIFAATDLSDSALQAVDRGFALAAAIHPQTIFSDAVFHLKNKRPLLHSRQVLQAVVATWQSSSKEPLC